MSNLQEESFYFVTDQDGSAEREFKMAVVHMLNQYKKLVRAYLVQVKYKSDKNRFNIALCFRVEDGYDDYILHEAMKVFKSMFNHDEHLDVIFLNQQQEIQIRKIGCPFFTSSLYQFAIPDFYLVSNEGYKLEEPLACFKRKRLYGTNPNGYLLCDIEPPLSGQNFSIDSKNITRIVLASRFLHYSLFPVKEWPTYVHVAIPLKNLDEIDFIEESDVKLVAWGEIYEQKDQALKSKK